MLAVARHALTREVILSRPGAGAARAGGVGPFTLGVVTVEGVGAVSAGGAGIGEMPDKMSAWSRLNSDVSGAFRCPKSSGLTSWNRAVDSARDK